MMRVDGVDPLVMNKIQDRAQQKQVEETRQPATDTRVRQREQALGREHYNEETKSHQERLEEEVARLNETAELFNIGLRFSIHKESERIMVQVYDRVEDKVIKEIPPERVLNLVAQIQNMIGILLDEHR
ncbi:MAG: flagellar protein FlaG [Firmicutes bacterium]|nr:flagellar protein FlaG [Bacillota bacterium]